MLLLLLSLLGILLHNVSGNTSSCNTDDLKTCRANALEQMSSSSSGDSVHEERQCKDLRENFDCMLWQTSMCYKKEDQDSNSDVIWKTWRYLGGVCEKYIRWWANSCFQRDDVKRCESLLPSKRNSLDGQSCRMYVSFRECVLPIAESSCSSSDRSLLGSYFTEKGQQMAWRCPKDIDFTSMSAASAQQVDRRYPDMYGDSGETCMLSARNDLNNCQRRWEETQSDAMRRDDSDMRNHKLCCAFVDFENCMEEIHKKCTGVDAKNLIESFTQDAKSKLTLNCDDYTANKCNEAANSITPTKAAAVYFLLYLGYFLFVKEF